MSIKQAQPEKVVPTEEEMKKAQEIVQNYNNMRQVIQDMTNKINELDAERNEHALVVKNLTPLDPNRRCYRSIGGVLVERTVKEVLPIVQNNLNKINEWIKQRTEKLREKEKECDEFRVKYNIGLGKSLEDTENNNEEGKEKKQKNSGILA